MLQLLRYLNLEALLHLKKLEIYVHILELKCVSKIHRQPLSTSPPVPRVWDIRQGRFTGNGDIAGQLGLGIDFDGSGAFGVGGFLTNYAQGGLTFGFNGDVGGFLGIHSYQFLEPRMEMQELPRLVFPPA